MSSPWLVGTVSLALLLLSAPLAVQAQPAGKVYRIGYLGTTPPTSRIWDALLEGLRERGYVEGRNFVFERRFSEGRAERYPGLVAELVQLKVDIVLTAGGGAPVRAIKAATTTIPIVMVVPGDPIAQELVSSLARPGGNVTGLSSVVDWEIDGKRLDLLKQAVPRISRIGVIYWTLGMAGPYVFADRHKELPAAARALSVALIPTVADTAEQLPEAFATINRERADALFVGDTGLNFRHRQRIADFAASHRLGTIAPWREFVEAGGLMSYGVDLAGLFRRAPFYVDKIFKGANPGELPIERPTTFELVLNFRTANTLSLTFPEALLIQATEIIK